MKTPPAIAGFEGEVGHETRNKGGLWELGKARKQIFPFKSPERNTTLATYDFDPMRSTTDF